MVSRTDTAAACQRRHRYMRLDPASILADADRHAMRRVRSIARESKCRIRDDRAAAGFVQAMTDGLTQIRSGGFAGT